MSCRFLFCGPFIAELTVFRVIFQKSREDAGIRYTCVRAACSHSASSSEVSRRLQGIKDDLEKAVNLMERERPGDCDHISMDVSP